jgi:hypothetical protein
MYCYSNDGTSMRTVPDNYVAETGEVLFSDIPQPSDLTAAFPNYSTTIAPFLQLQYTQAAQNLLDSAAQTKGYDSMLSLASYATSTNSTFQAQAVAGIAWRDSVWAEGYSILAQVQAGTLAQPAVDAFLAMLPAIVWPS